ncbi:hypothetical protein [Alteromonas halophila]|uniref:Uncharacterized protein n=1 Tax=Alteromonas halophila TaxID=516698 RepID=A0A918JNR6_9ALTE|nr:hypothetical protein [Alteromonas halophila]GGW93331.1 hypothetical protein GCM10007391_29580 [Alteromonas halophila]
MHSILWEIVVYSCLIFIGSALLHYLAFRKGVLSQWDEDTGQHALSSEQEDESNDEASHPLIEKWLTFGGGYYGITAFAKLITIELSQAHELATHWPGIDTVLPHPGLNGLINMFVNFFVAQYINFAEAVSWPAYYVSHFPIWQCALFVVITYLVFRGAQHMAWQYFLKKHH